MPIKRNQGRRRLSVDIDQEVFDKLRLKAAVHRRNLTDEVRAILADYCRPATPAPDVDQEKS